MQSKSSRDYGSIKSILYNNQMDRALILWQAEKLTNGRLTCVDAFGRYIKLLFHIKWFFSEFVFFFTLLSKFIHGMYVRMYLQDEFGL